MSEQDFFRDALSDFTYEAASGGAIRHLTDLGYTVKQIGEKLTYPTPYERVRKTVWQQLLDTKVILTVEPGSGSLPGKAEYTMERDKYGRISYRLVRAGVETGKSVPGKKAGTICFKEKTYDRVRDGSLAEYLAQKCDNNDAESVYITCSFGMCGKAESEEQAAAMQVLNDRQREYILGLPWEHKVCYHRLDQRMREIVVKLHSAGYYQGYAYFMKTAEKIKIG